MEGLRFTVCTAPAWCNHLSSFGIFSPDPDKAGPSDPLAALEKTTQANAYQKSVEVPRLEALQSLSEHYNSDPYTHSLRMRKHFRVAKKLDKARKDADDAVKDKYALPESLALVADDDAIKEEARDAFVRAKKERSADEMAKQRRLTAEVGLLEQGLGPVRSSLQGRLSRPVRGSRSATVAAAGASSSLRSRLLQSSVRSSDPFLKQDKSRPPDAKALGINVKKS